MVFYIWSSATPHSVITLLNLLKSNKWKHFPHERALGDSFLTHLNVDNLSRLRRCNVAENWRKANFWRKTIWCWAAEAKSSEQTCDKWTKVPTQICGGHCQTWFGVKWPWPGLNTGYGQARTESVLTSVLFSRFRPVVWKKIAAVTFTEPKSTWWMSLWRMCGTALKYFSSKYSVVGKQIFILHDWSQWAAEHIQGARWSSSLSSQQKNAACWEMHGNTFELLRKHQSHRQLGHSQETNTGKLCCCFYVMWWNVLFGIITNNFTYVITEQLVETFLDFGCLAPPDVFPHSLHSGRNAS